MEFKSLLDYAKKCIENNDIMDSFQSIIDNFKLNNTKNVAVDSGIFVEKIINYLISKFNIKKCSNITLAGRSLDCLRKYFKDNNMRDYQVLVSILESIYTIRSTVVHDFTRADSNYYYLIMAVYWSFVKLLELLCNNNFDSVRFIVEMFTPIENIRKIDFTEDILIKVDENEKYSIADRILFILYKKSSECISLNQICNMLGIYGKNKSSVSTALHRLRKKELVIYNKKDKRGGCWKISLKGKKKIFTLIR